MADPRQVILDELNRLRRETVTDPDIAGFQQTVASIMGNRTIVLDDDLKRPLTIDVVNTLIKETVDAIMAAAQTPQGEASREAITTRVEQLLLWRDVPGIDPPPRDVTPPSDFAIDADTSVVIQSIINDKNRQLRIFPDAPTDALRLNRAIKALRQAEARKEGSTGMTEERMNAILNPSSVTFAQAAEARTFLEEFDVDAFFDSAAAVQIGDEPIGKFQDKPQNVGDSLRIAINSFDTDTVRRGGASFPGTFLPEPDPRPEGFERLVSIATPPTGGRLPKGAAQDLVNNALSQQGVALTYAPYTQDQEGLQTFNTVILARDRIVDRVQEQINAGKFVDFPAELATFVQEEALGFRELFVEAAESIRLGEEADKAAADSKADADRAAKILNEKAAGDKALKDAIHRADSSASIDRLLPDDIEEFRERVLRNEELTKGEVQSATERFERDEQAKEDAEAAKDAAEAQAELDRVEAAEAVAAGRFAISDGEILRALEEAGIGNVGDTGDYQQFLRSLIPEIRDNLESVRRLDPTATLDVKALLTGIGPEDAGVTGQFDTAIGGILAGIEGFQTPQEFRAEQVRLDESRLPQPDDALRIRQDLDKIQEEERLRDESRLPQLPVPFQTADDPNIFGDEQIGADLLPPGVPGLPTLDDTGVISSSALDAQREKALQLEIPDFGEIQDLVANLSGGNPELQRFIFENLDLDAIKKTGRDEAARRRQEAFEHAARLSETPEPFVMPDIDPNRLPTGSMDRLIKQREQRSTTPVLTGPQSARFADRPLPKVKFAPLVEEQLPELTRRFEQSPAQVAIRQREIEAEEQEKKREAEAEDVRRQSRALRRGRTVFSRG